MLLFELDPTARNRVGWLYNAVICCNLLSAYGHISDSYIILIISYDLANELDVISVTKSPYPKTRAVCSMQNSLLHFGIFFESLKVKKGG